MQEALEISGPHGSQVKTDSSGENGEVLARNQSHQLLEELNLEFVIELGNWACQKNLTSVFEITAGERRFRAMTEVLGYDEVPAIVMECDDETASAIMLAENSARQDLSPVEQAKAYQSRVDRFGWTISKLADVAGVSTRQISSRLKLLALREEIQELVDKGQMPMSHAECLNTLDRDRQLSAVRIFTKSKYFLNLPTFEGIVGQLRDEQNQDAMFNLADTFLDQYSSALETFETVGDRKEAIFNDLPISDHLPKVQFETKRTADVMLSYVNQLKDAGFESESAAVGKLFKMLVDNRMLKVHSPNFKR